MAPQASAEAIQSATDAHSAGLWSFLGLSVTGFFGWLGKSAWDRRKSQGQVMHSSIRAELVAMRTEMHSQQAEHALKLADILQLQNEDATDRAAFRASIEARMATRDDLHEMAEKLAARLDFSVTAVHTRLNDHVRDYHLQRP